MRKNSCLLILLSLVTLSALASAQSTLVRANFDIPEATPQDDYLPGGAGDILNCNYFQRSWDPIGPTGGWLTNQFRAPYIVNPATPGFQGGNVMEGNSNSAAETRQGYWVQLQGPITGSFTVEVVFLLRTYTPAYAEHKMQNLVSSFWMSDNKAFEIRTLGDYGTRSIQLMTHDGGTEHNVASPDDAIQDNTWYHAAIVYDHSTQNASFYLDGAKIGSASPNWGTFSWNMVCMGAWPNPAGTCRDIDGYIDGFSVRDEVLGPEGTYNFVLPTSFSGAEDWKRY